MKPKAATRGAAPERPIDARAPGALELRPALPADFDLLARLNRELIDDEGHRNPMAVAELKVRFEAFVETDGWNVDLFLFEGAVAGFATYRHEPDVTEPSGRRVYLRQFYIGRNKRGSGLGRQAFELLMQRRFQRDDRILLEVLESNPGGQRFWSSVGFAPYSSLMERRAGSAIDRSTSRSRRPRDHTQNRDT